MLFAGLIEALERELADRLEHSAAASFETQQALLSERLERDEIGLADVDRGLGTEAAGEHAEPGTRRLCIRLE